MAPDSENRSGIRRHSRNGSIRSRMGRSRDRSRSRSRSGSCSCSSSSRSRDRSRDRSRSHRRRDRRRKRRDRRDRSRDRSSYRRDRSRDRSSYRRDRSRDKSRDRRNRSRSHGRTREHREDQMYEAAIHEKRRELDVLKDIDLEADVCNVPLPCVSAAQTRFELVDVEGHERVRVMKRSIMDELMDEANLHASRRHNNKHLYVHGPKGVGKSHCLLAVAAGLWQRRLTGEDAALRIVYIPMWFASTFKAVLQDLLLTFIDDADVFAALRTAKTSADVNLVLRAVAKKYSIIAILDQVRDSPEATRSQAIAPGEYFEGCATLVTASSPRFEQQHKLLRDDSLRTEVFFVPAGLTQDDEFVRFMAIQHPDLDLNDTHRNTLYEISGGVPMFINELVEAIKANVAFGGAEAAAEGDEAEDLVLAAMDCWSREAASDMSGMITKYYKKSLRDSPYSQELLIGFLQCALDPNNVELDRPTLEVADLRYIEILKKNRRIYLKPMCPAALFAIIEFMRLHVALKSAARSEQLVGILTAALNNPEAVRAESARGYLKETRFLTQLQLRRGTTIQVGHTVKVPAKLKTTSLAFEFTFATACKTFTITPLLTEEDKQNRSILFLPKRTSEPFVDAAVFDYTNKRVIAIQVTAQTPREHAKSLRFFSENVSDYFKSLIEIKSKKKWSYSFVWVLTNDHTNVTYPPSAEVQQFSMQASSL